MYISVLHPLFRSLLHVYTTGIPTHAYSQKYATQRHTLLRFFGAPTQNRNSNHYGVNTERANAKAGGNVFRNVIRIARAHTRGVKNTIRIAHAHTRGYFGHTITSLRITLRLLYHVLTNVEIPTSKRPRRMPCAARISNRHR